MILLLEFLDLTDQLKLYLSSELVTKLTEEDFPFFRLYAHSSPSERSEYILVSSNLASRIRSIYANKKT